MLPAMMIGIIVFALVVRFGRIVYWVVTDKDVAKARWDRNFAEKERRNAIDETLRAAYAAERSYHAAKR